MNPAGITIAAPARSASTSSCAAAGSSARARSTMPALTSRPSDLVGQRRREPAAVLVDDDDRRMERLAEVRDDRREGDRQTERRDDREEDRRAVAQPLAQDPRGDDAGRRARRPPPQSRRALPVRWRKTALEVGLDDLHRADRDPVATQRPRAAAAGAGAPRRRGGRSRRRAAWRSGRPGSSGRRPRPPGRSPAATRLTRSTAPTSATSSRRVPSAMIRPSSMIPTRSHSRSASSM